MPIKPIDPAAPSARIELSAREQRLKAALRDNLRRRKQPQSKSAPPHHHEEGKGAIVDEEA